MSLTAQEPHSNAETFDPVARQYMNAVASPAVPNGIGIHVHRAWRAIHLALMAATKQVAGSEGVAVLGTIDEVNAIVVLRADVVSLVSLTGFNVEPQAGEPVDPGAVQIVQFRRSEDTQVRVARKVDGWDGAFSGVEVLELDTHGGVVRISTEELYGEPRIAEVVAALLV